jgi:hypothetical protein
MNNIHGDGTENSLQAKYNPRKTDRLDTIYE